MKQRVTILFILFTLLCLAAYYIHFFPLRTGYLQISVSARGHQTNATGQVLPAFAISNAGPHVVSVFVGSEVKVGDRHFRYDLGSGETLKPGEEAVLTAMPSLPPQSRLLVFCQKIYSRDWMGRGAWLLDAHILKRGVVERIYPAEDSK